MSLASRLMRTETAATAKPPTSDGHGNRDGKVPYLTGVKHTPIDPASAQNPLVQEVMLDGPLELWECESDDVDIQKGHDLISGGITYTVRNVGRYVGPTFSRVADAYRYLVLGKPT